MWIITALLACAASCSYVLYKKRRAQHDVFRSLGIPGPEPHWLWGNWIEMISGMTHQKYQEWTNRYGKTYGVYRGTSPCIVTSDPSFIKEVFVKQFSNFHGRMLSAMMPDPEKIPRFVQMFLARGHTWKRLRTIINPTFSSAKLKQLFGMVAQKSCILAEKLDEAAQSQQPIDIQQYYQRLTLDVIGDAAFGIEVAAQTNDDEPFLKSCKEVFVRFGAREKSTLATIVTIFPPVRDVIMQVVRFIMKVSRSNPGIELGFKLEELIKLRKQQQLKRPDLLQLMLDAELEDKDLTSTSSSALSMSTEEQTEEQDTAVTASEEKPEAKIQSTHNANDQRLQRVNKKLSAEEVKNQALLFLLAGYETTSTALTYVTYLLANNPEKQRKLQEKVDEVITGEGRPSYEQVQSIAYLDWVIRETLRLYPLAALLINRQCMEPCIVEGIPISRGMYVQADVWSLHYNPDLWGPTDPKLFEPERFAPEYAASRDPMAWIPFGAGPRNCVGLRFGLMEAKITLATLIKQFTFETSKKCMDVWEAGVIAPKDGLTVTIVRR